jgi:lipopolysaccharide/colanic/teichoic acid biosynthesis glycosyltransferase
LNEGNKRAYEIVKRSNDLAFAVILGLMSLLFYPFVIILIKATSEGSVFYKQSRIGQAGKIFQIIKFRTMNKDAEKNTGAVWASNNDPRITKIGRFMRKTRIDELPQLWNILKGQMAFIGPRAERTEFNEQ